MGYTSDEPSGRIVWGYEIPDPKKERKRRKRNKRTPTNATKTAHAASIRHNQPHLILSCFTLNSGNPAVFIRHKRASTVHFMDKIWMGFTSDDPAAGQFGGYEIPDPTSKKERKGHQLTTQCKWHTQPPDFFFFFSSDRARLMGHKSV